MGIRDTLRANAAHLLQAGESIHAVIPAQAISGWFALLSVWVIVFQDGARVIVVTDRRILVCRSGRVRMTPVKEVLTQAPRSTRIGPPSGLWHKTGAFGEVLYVHKRFHKDIEAVDALAPALVPASGPPPAAWARDPSGRHELRYWDGTRWTEHVSTAGVQGTDGPA
jgi:hypothetical protein